MERITTTRKVEEGRGRILEGVMKGRKEEERRGQERGKKKDDMERTGDGKERNDMDRRGKG
jgi:hypothetical protein